jgi:hypothetical protein
LLRLCDIASSWSCQRRPTLNFKRARKGPQGSRRGLAAEIAKIESRAT